MLAATDDGPQLTLAGEPPIQKAQEAVNAVSIAILCGGSSRRMGTDKALLSLRPGLPPMLALVIDRVRGLTDDLFLVGVHRAGYDRFGPPLVRDRYPGAGPLGGIATALAASKHARCLVVGCDMPFLDGDFLQWMVRLPRDQADALVPVLSELAADGTTRLVPQPLHAIYSRQCLPAVERCLLDGERCATSFYTRVRVATLSPAQFSSDETRLRSFFSVDTPAAVRLAQTWLPR